MYITVGSVGLLGVEAKIILPRNVHVGGNISKSAIAPTPAWCKLRVPGNSDSKGVNYEAYHFSASILLYTASYGPGETEVWYPQTPIYRSR